jgi:hypothetical protein
MGLFKRLRSRLKKVGDAIEMWWVKRNCVGHIEGIVICDPAAKNLSQSTFLKSTREAMELIHTVDPRRYARICHQFRYIVNAPLISRGSYRRALKRCNVDYTKNFTTANPKRNLRRYACLLIHEATHGLLFEKGIPYNKENWQRIEKLCREEEYRFARRIEPVWAEKYVRPFNPEGWKLFYGSRQARLAATWRRIREIFKALNSSK